MSASSPELIEEQEHLAQAREELARMRRRTESMDASAGGDWVSREFLKSTFVLRMRQLADDPTVPLFFGRLDYEAGELAGERFHIGRRHVSDGAGEPLVVDWRAPVSLPFYRATALEPMGVALRRRYGFVNGRLTAYEDEALTAEPTGEEYSAILEAEIERPRVGPMRDIVATIQPEQDVIVRADLSTSLCVQGAPGTGKTAVGLHRAAFLLFAHREQLTRQGVMVIGPNASFLRYIRDVLPALGEIDAQQATIEELVSATLRRINPRWQVRGEDPTGVAMLKADARMAEVLHRAIWSRLVPPGQALVVPRGSRRFRVPAYEIEETVAGLRSRGVRYAAARAMLPQALAHRVLVKMEQAGDSPDDRVQNAVARSKPVKAVVDAIWPAVDAAKVVHRLLSEPQALAAAADGILTDEEQQALLWPKPPRSPGSARWSLHDAVLIDEAADRLERTGSLGHIVADEAQDLSPMMLRALARRSSTGSVTVLGDLAQATTPWATRSWSEALGHLGKPDAHVEQLVRGFRVPGEVIEFAARLLPRIAPSLEPPTSVRRSRGELTITATAAGRSGVDADALAAVLQEVLRREGSVGLILPDAMVGAVRRVLDTAGIGYATVDGATHEAEEPSDQDGSDRTPGGEAPVDGPETEFDTRLDLVPASLAKGLEFDHVVLLEPEAIVAAEPDRVTGLRRLYVCLTRAVTSLAVLHAEPLPEELAA